MTPHLLSLYFPAFLLPLLFLQLTRNHLLVSSKAETQNITKGSIFFTTQLSSTAWKDTTWMGCLLDWVLSPGCSLVRGGERAQFGETHWHLHENSHGRLANERLRQMDVLHQDRLNTIRPSHYLLYMAKYCNSKSSHDVVPQQGGWQGTQSSVDRGSKRRDNRVLVRDLGKRRTKKAGTDLVWLSGAGDNGILKISWGVASV